MPASKPEAVSLDEFAEANAPKRGSFLDTLPEEIQEQLLTSKASPRLASEWLASLGYQASNQMIYDWRRRSHAARS